ncbi:multicopper oxidase domain-containing protein [Streptomyces sp. NBC_01190]|uniref:multicopper oxidase domain-containing protein n=1 Tax=Streptomyces sp. NBC_01190 TaxID=2903767 RepID=UPI00386E0392|nr:multicopper oxidase domain-containing protein [Streptomyces sp. NBC_01190]
MASDHEDPTPAGSGRRTLLRALTGGGALAALTLPGAAPRAAASTGEADVRPFAADTFRAGGRTREFWLQADSFDHNVAPNGYDGMMGTHFTADQTTFQAVGFRAYTADWGRPLDADTGPLGIGPNTGIPGPVLRARVGDVIKVHFKNNDTAHKWPHSVHPHGVRYDQDSDGGWLADVPDRPGTAVPFGGTYTYTWMCTPGSVGSWPYHDHAAPQSVAHAAATGTAPAAGMASMGHGGGGGGGPVMEIGAELGLFGMLAITDADTPEVDREFVLFFHDVSAADAPPLAQDVSLCNGGAFVDNAPTFTAKVGERVRWRVGTLGNSFHTFHIHGHRWWSSEGWVDTQVLGPATTLTVEYLEDNPGDWIYHCHVPGHMMRGMAGRYRVPG